MPLYSDSSSSSPTTSSRDNPFLAAQKKREKVGASFDALFEKAGLIDDESSSTPSGASTSDSNVSPSPPRKQLASLLNVPPKHAFQKEEFRVTPHVSASVPDAKSLSSGSHSSGSSNSRSYYSPRSRSSGSSRTPINERSATRLNKVSSRSPPPPPEEMSSSYYSGSSYSRGSKSSRTRSERSNSRQPAQSTDTRQQIAPSLLKPSSSRTAASPSSRSSRRSQSSRSSHSRSGSSATFSRGSRSAKMLHESGSLSKPSPEASSGLSSGSKSQSHKLASAIPSPVENPVAHLSNLNQPNAQYDDDGDSLGSGDLFQAASTPKPVGLLAAAKAARSQIDANEESKVTDTPGRPVDPAAHLSNLNQPITQYDDDDNSLGSENIFESSSSAQKPGEGGLLAAAKRARTQINSREQPNVEPAASHLSNLNQPTTLYDDDGDSLAPDNLFEASTTAGKPSGGLLAAAKRARAQIDSKEKSEANPAAGHLSKLNQPTTKYVDEESIQSDDIFEAAPSTAGKPGGGLLAAAKRARAQMESKETPKVEPDTTPAKSPTIFSSKSSSRSRVSKSPRETEREEPQEKALREMIQKLDTLESTLDDKDPKREVMSSGSRVKSITMDGKVSDMRDNIKKINDIQSSKVGSQGKLLSNDDDSAERWLPPTRPALTNFGNQDIGSQRLISNPDAIGYSEEQTRKSLQRVLSRSQPETAKNIPTSSPMASPAKRLAPRNNTASARNYIRTSPQQFQAKDKAPPPPVEEIEVCPPADDESSLGSMGWLFPGAVPKRNEAVLGKPLASELSKVPSTIDEGVAQAGQVSMNKNITSARIESPINASEIPLNSSSEIRAVNDSTSEVRGVKDDYYKSWIVPGGETAEAERKDPPEQKSNQANNPPSPKPTNSSYTYNISDKPFPVTTTWVASNVRSEETAWESWVPNSETDYNRESTRTAPVRYDSFGFRSRGFETTPKDTVPKMSRAPEERQQTTNESYSDETTTSSKSFYEMFPASTAMRVDHTGRVFSQGRQRNMGRDASRDPRIVLQMEDTSTSSSGTFSSSTSSSSRSGPFVDKPKPASSSSESDYGYATTSESGSGSVSTSEPSSRERSSTLEVRSGSADYGRQAVGPGPSIMKGGNAKASPELSCRGGESSSSESSDSWDKSSSSESLSSGGESSETESSRSDAKGNSRRLNRLSLFCILVAVICGAIIAIVFLLVIDDNENPNVQSTPPPDSGLGAPGTASPPTSPNQPTEPSSPTVTTPPPAAPATPPAGLPGGPDPNDTLYQLIVNSFPSGESDLQDTSSAQFAALEWLGSSANANVDADGKLLQRYSLATLFFATKGVTWTEKDHWLSEDDECTWFTSSTKATGPCDADGNFIEINLRENNLQGPIPAEILLLGDLTILKLPSNALSGSIPTTISLLPLEELNLSGNELFGIVPSELGTMTSLERLVFFDNKLFSTIPSELGQLSRMELLDLGSNQLTGTIPAAIGNIEALAGLSVFNNFISGTLPASFSNLENMQLIYIDNTDITGGTEYVCGLDFDEFWADCEEVGCTCCNVCCHDNFGCV